LEFKFKPESLASRLRYSPCLLVRLPYCADKLSEAARHTHFVHANEALKRKRALQLQQLGVPDEKTVERAIISRSRKKQKQLVKQQGGHGDTKGEQAEDDDDVEEGIPELVLRQLAVDGHHLAKEGRRVAQTQRSARLKLPAAGEVVESKPHLNVPFEERTRRLLGLR
jgi:hypothetical protein